jgi:hypothetical protein
MESEMGGRLTSIEARMVGVEGRLTTISAGQNSHALALMRISDKLVDHDGRFGGLEDRLTRIEAKLDTMDARYDAIDKSLAAIAAKLPP